MIKEDTLMGDFLTNEHLFFLPLKKQNPTQIGAGFNNSNQEK